MSFEVTNRSEVFEWIKLLSTNATDSSFASRIPTTTEPTGTGVVSVGRPAHVCQNLMFAFFGAGADDATFDARIIGWQRVSTLWIPVPLAQLTCTLSTVVGVAGQAVIDTDRFADTYSLLSGFNSNVSVETVSPANNTMGHVLVDARGFSKIEVIFDMTGATSGNALYKGL